MLLQLKPKTTAMESCQFGFKAERMQLRSWPGRELRHRLLDAAGLIDVRNRTC